MKKFYNEYLRQDNRKTWIPLFLSAVTYVISLFLELILRHNTILFWLAFAFSVFCCVFFAIWSYKYVSKWHDIFLYLHKKDSTLLNTCAFLAVMERTQYRNESYCVSGVNIRYLFSDSPYKGGHSQYYPFHLTYRVSGTVIKPLSAVYFHVLNYNLERVFQTMRLETGGEAATKKLEAQYGNMQAVSFTLSQNFIPEHAFDYSLEMDFSDDAGLVADKSQRFLFYPKNLSSLYANATDIKLELVFPKKLYDAKIKKQFKSFFLRKYTDGLHEDINVPGYGPLASIINDEQVIIPWNIQINRDETDTLFAIEFTK